MQTQRAPREALDALPAVAPGAETARGSLQAVVAVVAGLVIIAYGASVPAQRRFQIDHHGMLNTLARMRGGAGYYQAFRTTYLVDIGVRLGGPRSFRTPYLALFLRWIPTGLLWPTFLLLVVGVTTACFLRTTRHPLAVLPVTLYLLMAGRMPAFGGGVEGWLLVELWTIPLLAASTLAWRRQRWWAAAGTAAAATLIRELAAPVLVIGLVMAIRRREPVKPWLVGLGVAVAGWALHIALALQVGSSHGNESTLFGTGRPPSTVFAMMTFAMAIPAIIPIALWALAGVRLATQPRRSVPPVAILALLPLMGVLISRPYWGLPIIPFVVLWGGEELGDRWQAWRAAEAAKAAETAPAASATA